MERIALFMEAAMLAQCSFSLIQLYFHRGAVFERFCIICTVRYAEDFLFCLLSHKSIHTACKAAVVLTMSFQGDLQNGLSLKNFANKTLLELLKNCRESPDILFSPDPVPMQSMARQIEI